MRLRHPRTMQASMTHIKRTFLLWSENCVHRFQPRDKCVVYKKTSDVVFFITGSGEYTELICTCCLWSVPHSERGAERDHERISRNVSQEAD